MSVGNFYFCFWKIMHSKHKETGILQTLSNRKWYRICWLFETKEISNDEWPVIRENKHQETIFFRSQSYAIVLNWITDGVGLSLKEVTPNSVPAREQDDEAYEVIILFLICCFRLQMVMGCIWLSTFWLPHNCTQLYIAGKHMLLYFTLWC